MLPICGEGREGKGGGGVKEGGGRENTAEGLLGKTSVVLTLRLSTYKDLHIALSCTRSRMGELGSKCSCQTPYGHIISLVYCLDGLPLFFFKCEIRRTQ